MQKIITFIPLLALSSLFSTHAQDSNAVGHDASLASPSSQAAPIIRSYRSQDRGGSMQIFDLEPSAGVLVRGDVGHGVETVSSTGAATELRVVRGRADVTIHHPVNHSTILVDLPGGQVSLLKDGLYTFNAGTNTVRVLHGEAEAYRSAKDNSKGVKVKETQQLAFFENVKLKAVNAYRYELTADLLAGEGPGRGDGYSGYRGYGDGFYGGYPYYAGGFGYPFGYGYPYGYGYPFGFGVGFGYYGGFGGFRGGGFRR